MNYYFSEDAVRDMEESELHYNNERFGLGEEFIDEIHSASLNVCESPEVWQTVYKGLKRYTLTRFPFYIIYRFHDDAIEIIAVSHNKRHPEHWKK